MTRPDPERRNTAEDEAPATTGTAWADTVAAESETPATHRSAAADALQDPASDDWPMEAEDQRGLEQAATALSDGSREPTVAASSVRSERALERAQDLGSRSVSEVLTPGALIGEGGMGRVRAAVQRSVGRSVAIKTLRSDRRSRDEEVQLLREAWLTASLEHPNVVPVHDVLLDPEQGPVIVLKRIRGLPWEQVIEDAETVRERFHADDLFSFNVEILMQLCRAVHFAHNHGVVHRDIKPDNVMIGRYGEVYLADWGIAVSLGDDPTGRLPLASESSGLAGTPAYMAPEMLEPECGGIDARTDVYLLGAVLHRIVTGEPPHTGDDYETVVESIRGGRPSLDDALDEPLRRILERAMAPDPGDRFADAEQLRLELRRYLYTRDSMAMLARTLERLDELMALLETADETTTERIFALFGECRVGLTEALRTWPDNERAIRAQAELVHRMTEHLLALDDPGAARALLVDHDDPDPDLVARVDEALERQRLGRQELERLQRELDPRVGRAARRAAMVAMGVLWTVSPLVANYVDPAATPASMSYGVPAGLLVLAAGIWYSARHSLGKTAINRRILVAMLIGFCAHMVNMLVVQLAGLPPKSELAMGMVGFGAITAVLSYTAVRRLWPLAPIYWAGGLLGAAFLEQAAWVLSGCNLLLTLYVLAIWSPSRTGEQAPESVRLP